MYPLAASGPPRRGQLLAVLNEAAGYDNFPMFWQFLPLEGGLIFELVILDQY